MKNKHIKVLDHGSVTLLNLSGPVRRPDKEFDADDIDPAITARISFDNMDEVRLREQDLKLVKYLMDHFHWTPIEMIEVWLEMELPLLVARQFVRHRSACLNEVSARYTTLPGKWYIPEPENVGIKSKSNKQGRDMVCWDDLDPTDKAKVTQFLSDLDMHNRGGYSLYEHHLNHGIAPELARCFLQVNHYTHWVWKQDLRNMLGFLRLRNAPDAQFEAREFAKAIHSLLSSRLPETMKWLDQFDETQTPAPVPTRSWLWRFFNTGISSD